MVSRWAAAATAAAVALLAGCSGHTAPASFLAPAGVSTAATGATSAAKPAGDVPVLDAATYPQPGDGWVKRTAVVERVYDGDTPTVTLLDRTGPDEVHARTVTIRLAHVDTPELSGETKPYGVAARDAARRLMPVGSIVTVHDMGVEKYGRTLAQITTADGVNVGEALTKMGCAVAYEGEKKPSGTNWSGCR